MKGDDWAEMNRIIDAHGRAIDAINVTCNMLLSIVREREAWLRHGKDTP